jgi:DTW domain-containing protein YfiP
MKKDDICDEKNSSVLENKYPSLIPEDSEFSNLKMSIPYTFLNRQKCPKCNKSSLMYCPKCRIPLCIVPNVKLPILLDIVHHPKEKINKSTAIHACVLCPQQTTMWEFPNIPTFNPEETLVLFPSVEAKSLNEIDLKKFRRAVFIDCTWNQTHPIVTHPNIVNLTRIKIQNHRTLFWRYQNESPEFLATIEAIYFFFKEFYTVLNGGTYNSECDDILYFYAFQYEVFVIVIIIIIIIIII